MDAGPPFPRHLVAKTLHRGDRRELLEVQSDLLAKAFAKLELQPSAKTKGRRNEHFGGIRARGRNTPHPKLEKRLALWARSFVELQSELAELRAAEALRQEPEQNFEEDAMDYLDGEMDPSMFLCWELVHMA